MSLSEQNCVQRSLGILSVFKLQPIGPSGAASEFRRETFVLVGGKEYVLIADQNAELAQALLQFRLRARSWKK